MGKPAAVAAINAIENEKSRRNKDTLRCSVASAYLLTSLSGRPNCSLFSLPLQSMCSCLLGRKSLPNNFNRNSPDQECKWVDYMITTSEIIRAENGTGRRGDTQRRFSINVLETIVIMQVEVDCGYAANGVTVTIHSKIARPASWLASEMSPVHNWFAQR